MPFFIRGVLLSMVYGDDLAQLAVLHKILRPYRRRIINVEL